MTNTYFNFCNFLILSCLLPLNIGSSAIAQQPPKSTPTQAQNPAPIEPSASRFVGQWRLKDYLPIPVTVLFTQDGKLLVLLPSYVSSFWSAGSPSLSRGSVRAFEYRYKINSTAQPMQIDLISPAENETVATIFEFTSDGQLRVEWEGINPGEPRPTEFTAGAIYLQKVANTAALPRNTQIIDLAAQKRQARESEGREYIKGMNRAQQAVYAEKQKFATAIDDLGLTIKSETENYSFQIAPQSASIPSVMMIAKAKSPELKSYTGAVFVIKVNDEFIRSVSVVCETDRPSTVPPAMPIAPKNAEEKIKCPAGSTAIP